MDQDSELEMKLISHITQFLSLWNPTTWLPDYRVYGADLISMARSLILDSHPKPESKFMSLITQIFHVFNSMDLDSQPKPLSELILHLSTGNSEPRKIVSLLDETVTLEPEPEIVSLIYHLFSLVISMRSEFKKLIPLCPQGKGIQWEGNKWRCSPGNWEKFRLEGKEYETHFLCRGCNGENHKEDRSPPVEINHPLHPKHFLQLSYFNKYSVGMGEFYCCGDDIEGVYYCSICSLSINFSCSEKLPEISKDHPKWHEHTLVLFPSQDSLTCNLCALKDSNCPFYICPPCTFVVHQSCLHLPRVVDYN